jgi:hypothetical protein
MAQSHKIIQQECIKIEFIQEQESQSQSYKNIDSSGPASILQRPRGLPRPTSADPAAIRGRLLAPGRWRPHAQPPPAAPRPLAPDRRRPRAPYSASRALQKEEKK